MPTCFLISPVFFLSCCEKTDTAVNPHPCAAPLVIINLPTQGVLLRETGAAPSPAALSLSQLKID